MSLLLSSSLFSCVVVTCSWSSNCGRRERVLAKSCLQSGSDAGLGEQQNSCRVLIQLALDAHTSSAAESSAKHSDPHCTCTHTYTRFFQLDSSRFVLDFSGLRGLSCCERLNILGFQTLECRRFINDLTLCYNILHGLCDTSLSINLSNSVTLGNCLKLVKPTRSSDIRKYFFTSRVIDVWSYLNDDTVKSPSISVFKKRLSGVKFDRFLTVTD